MTIKVAIYEDNTALRESLVMLLSGLEDYAVVGAFGNCLNAAQDTLQLQPDVVLMDIDLPGRSGIEGVLTIKNARPATEVLMLTIFDDDDRVFQALCAGAGGYLLKRTPPVKILEAIREVCDGGAPMTPVIARKVLALFPRKPAANQEMDKLSPREQEVLQSLSEGNSHKMVANTLHISIDTVRSHVKKIYEKLHVHSVSEAIAKAFLKK